MPDPTYKSAGAIATTTTTALSVPLPAVAAGDYAVMDIFVGASTTPPTIAGWALAWQESGDGRFIYWKAFTGTASATNVAVTVASGGAYGKIVVASGAGTTAPTVVEKQVTGSPWASAALTLTGTGFAVHFSFLNAVRTQGTITNSGTITATNTSRAFDSILGAYNLQVVTSVITSAGGGAVTATYTGGSTLVDTVTVVIPAGAPAAPSGLAVSTSDVGELGISFGPVTGADSYQVRFRQTGLTIPTGTTQSSAPGHLARVNAQTPGTAYTYTWNGAGVRVYMVDGGIRYTHHEFTGRTRAGHSYGSTPYDSDPLSHGTGTSAAGVGTTYGVAKGATVVSVSVYDAPDAIANKAGAATLQNAFDFILADLAASPAPAVVNISLGLLGMQLDDPDSADVQTQLGRLLSANIPICLSLGNNNEDITSKLLEGDSRLMWVGYSTTADVRGSASNYAAQSTVFAPVDGMTTASSSSDTATQVGGQTSEAAPMLSGTIAKILHANPGLSVARIKDMVTSQSWAVITSVPTGPNLLLNANATPTEWSVTAAPGTTLTLDGLGPATDWDIAVRTVQGSATSDWSSTVSGTTGAAMPHGSASGTVAYSGAAAGHQDPHGAASGSAAFAGAASGHMEPHGAGAGSVVHQGAASGHMTPHGAATGELAFTGEASGHADPHGSASGTVTYTGAAAGHAPDVTQPHGSATGSITYVGAATGSMQPSGAASGAVEYTGEASGHLDPHGAGDGAVAYVGAASGHAPAVGVPHGAASGVIEYASAATGHMEPHGTVAGAVVYHGTAHGTSSTDRDLSLTVTPLAPRWTIAPTGTRWTVTPAPERWETTCLQP